MTDQSQRTMANKPRASRPARIFGPQLEEVLDQVLHCEPVGMAQLRSEIPQEMERIIGRALAKKPEERYQIAGDLELDFHSLRRLMEC